MNFDHHTIRWTAILAALALLPCSSHADDGANTVVVVAGKKELVAKRLDKTVYDVSNLPKAANGSAQDILQSTPELSVSADGQLAVKGNTQVTVLVNGKPTAMLSGEERAVALQTMSGADIASIEVITNPSAAYQGNGGAIVNIVLKRNRKPGAHAQVQASASDQSLWNASTSGDLTRGTVSVHGNLAIRRDGTLKQRASSIDWINPLSGQHGRTEQSSEVFIRRAVSSAALGADMNLSDTDSINLSARHSARRSLPLLDTLNLARSGTDESVFHRISYGPNEQADNSASLNYSRQDSGTALKAMLQRSTTSTLIDKSYRDVYLQPAREPGYSRGATRSARHLNQATLDWSRAAERGQWGMGLDLQEQVDDIGNYQARVDPLGGAETPDPATTNGYAVNTTLGALYITRQIKADKWEMLLGGRAEHMALRVSPAQGVMQRGHWQAFNPSLHAKYAVDDDADVTLSYRRSLQRPDSRDLNPYTTYIDAQNLSRGNPALKPQQLSSWELVANRQAARLSGSVGAFYRTSRDTVTDARSFADTVLVTSKQNGGQAHSAGLTGALDWKRDAALQAGVDGGVYRVTLDTPDLAVTLRQSGVAAYLNARASYSVGMDELSLDAHGQSSGITPLGRVGATSSMNLVWKHRFSSTLSLTVNANDLFDGSRRSYHVDTTTFRQSGAEHFVARRLYIGLVKKID